MVERIALRTNSPCEIAPVSTAQPSDPFVVTLHSQRVARISKPATGWPKYVRLEILPAPGITAEIITFGRWEVGSASARKLLERDAHLVEVETLQVDNAAANFIRTQQDVERQIADEREVQAHPTSENWGLLELECWSEASKGAHQIIPITDLDNFLKVCAQPQGDGVYLKWPKRDMVRLTILDCDFHQPKLHPPQADLAVLMSTLSPMPAAMHRTSRGFHAIYAPYGGLTAEDLAVAASAALTLSPTVRAYQGTVELLNRTRHPKSLHNGKIYGDLQRVQPDCHIPLLDIFDRIACTETERDEVMNHMGLRPGQRLPHAHCPIDPNHASSSPAPVIVSEHGVFCYSCQGRTGVGFLSWGALRRQNGFVTQTTADTSIMRDAIQHFAPHAHVSRLFEALSPHLDARFHRTLHRALLSKQHEQVAPEMVDAVFATFPFVRNVDGLWCHEDTLRPTSPRIARTALSACSAALRPLMDPEDGSIDLRPVPNLLNVLETDGVAPGLYPLIPTVLSPIWHVYHQTTLPGCVAVQPRQPEKSPLRYLPAKARIPMAEAMAKINSRYPGIDFNYLTLIHVARGWGEEGTSQMPMIWATGETSTGKTSHVDIECAMHGEDPLRLTIPHDRIEDLDEEIAAGQGRNGHLLLDDFCKNLEGRIGMQRLNNTTAFLLRFSRSVSFHAMYVGEKVTRVTTPLIMTDMRHPAELVANEQIGRRVVMAQLHKQVQWKGGFINWWRGDLREAVESWHSHVVDQYFGADRPTPFVEIAHQLGYTLLNEVYGQNEEAGARTTLVKEFMRHLLKKPEASGQVSGTREQTAEQMSVCRARGPGWVILNANQPGPLEETAQILCHSLNYEYIVVEGLKKALEPYQARLHDMLPFNEQVRIEIEGYREHAVVVRLRAARRSKPLRLGVDTLAVGATADNLLDPQWNRQEMKA